MSNLLEVYRALAEFGRQRAARRAAAGQTSAADVRILAGPTSAAGWSVSIQDVSRDARPAVGTAVASIAQ